MDYQKPTTETKDAEETREHLGEVLDQVARGHHRTIVARDGKAVAAIIPISDFRRLERDDERIEEWFKTLEAIREPFKDVPPEEIEEEVARALAEVRAEMFPAENVPAPTR